MMSELHWTGAALLLALMALSSRASQPRRETIISWDDFARQHGLAADGLHGSGQTSAVFTPDDEPEQPTPLLKK